MRLMRLKLSIEADVYLEDINSKPLVVQSRIWYLWSFVTLLIDAKVIIQRYRRRTRATRVLILHVLSRCIDSILCMLRLNVILHVVCIPFAVAIARPKSWSCIVEE